MNKRPGPGWACYVEVIAGRVVRAGRTTEEGFARVRPAAGGEIIRTPKLSKPGDVWSGAAKRVYRTKAADPEKRRKAVMAEKAAALSFGERRAAAYPPLGDLADALFWRAKGDHTKFDAWVTAIDAVKTRIPKE